MIQKPFPPLRSKLRHMLSNPKVFEAAADEVAIKTFSASNGVLNDRVAWGHDLTPF